VHILATRGGHELFGLNDSYLYEIIGVWVWLPQNAWTLAAALLVVWSHGCIGIHLRLRLRPWYQRARPWLLTAALLLPGLALSGFAGVGNQIALWAKDEAWRTAALASFRIGDNVNALVDFVQDTMDYVVAGTIIVIVLLLAGRWIRSQWARRGARIVITYPDGEEASVEPGLSVLDASRLPGIVHASICGGRGRCSTCRVRIAEGAATLPPVDDDELKVLARVGAPYSVRLACQLKPTADVSVIPLLPPNVGVQGSERVIAVLFVDLRSFTKFSESKLPYGVVFALNQNFRGMGQAVEEAGGHLDKFIGDGVMALFGVRDDLEQGCQQALEAAAGMSHALEHLNHQLLHDLDQPLRIGIHAGPAIVGEMGYLAETTITAIGDNINTALRLETITKEFTMQAVISAQGGERAGADLSAFEIRQVTVRGRSEPMAVHLIPDARSLAAARCPNNGANGSA